MKKLATPFSLLLFLIIGGVIGYQFGGGSLEATTTDERVVHPAPGDSVDATAAKSPGSNTGAMGKWFFIVESNCTDEAREADFNEWYDKIDLPDVLETAGFVKATRYKCESARNQSYDRIAFPEEKGKYLALYEIETDDIDGVMKELLEGVAVMRERGRLTDLIAVVSRGLYKEISTLSN